MAISPFEKQTKLKLVDIVKMPNVAAKLSDEELAYYGAMAVAGYEADKRTRNEWEARNAKAIKLALQLAEKKTFPWNGASNVKFPLVTIAALQFLARISTLTGGRQLAKLEAWGADPEGKKAARGERIGTHLSYQLLEQNRGWVDDDEQAKFSAALLGCAIKKTFHDGVEGANRCEYVPIMNFVVDYFCKDLSKAQRITQLLELFPNEIAENTLRGLYLPMDDEGADAPIFANASNDNQLRQVADETAGLNRQTDDALRPFAILEQHCWLDLDGDGYAEPYVMIVRYDTKQVLRIAARFFDQGDVYRVNDAKVRQLEAKAREQKEPGASSAYEREAQRLAMHADNKIIRILPTENFTRYLFIPAPDGGFYGLGLGALLGPTNAAVDSLINQIIDAGTMLTTNGGFLGRGVKIKSGKQSFDPFEWKPVDGAGDDLRKNIMPLPVNTPPDIMFQLLGLLISYGEKIGSATDVMTGVSPGQNTPAETSRNTLEQGMMLFSGIYKRMYRGFAEELRKLYQLNKWYIRQAPDFRELTEGEGALFAADDYDTNAYRVFPSADPTAVSPGQVQQKAKLVFEVSQARPNGFDMYHVVRRLLEAHEVPSIEEIYPDPKGPKAIAPIPNPKIELEKAKLQQKDKIHEDEMSLEIVRLRQEIGLNEAKTLELEAKAQKHAAEAQGVGDGHAIALLEAQIGAAKAHREQLLRVLDVMQRHHEASQTHQLKVKQGESNAGKQGGDAGVGQAG
jgi:chaperonin GroES